MRARGDQFEIVAVLDVGLNPHQIAFAADGATAYVAAAGSDQVTEVAVGVLRVMRHIPVADAPLGVAVLPGKGGLAVSRFGADRVARVRPGDPDVEQLETGGAPSLLVPTADQRYLVSVEEADKVWVLDGANFELEASYDTGDRPFPPAPTSDGRLVFVPNYNDGTVTVIDAWNARIVDTVRVGERPSGGVVFPDDIDYAVAVRGENKVLFLNTASRRVVDSIIDGIGESPFSVVLAPNGRLAFVNNTASHDISVIDVALRQVIARIPVGEQPIVMAVHPSGETLWVSSEGADELTIIEIPEAWRVAPPALVVEEPTEVAVLGMIHGRHHTSELWGLDELRETIQRLQPDAVCAEIPPDRIDEAWRDFRDDGVIEEPRVRVFPEYKDLMFALAEEMGFDIVPCAGWTTEMNDLRRTRMRQFQTEPQFAEPNADYQRRIAEARAQDPWNRGELDDPHILHSDLYDERIEVELSIYDEVLNDWIGPGGWTNINLAHMRGVNRAVDAYRGRRILVAFGGGHKYWILDALRERDDVELLDVRPFLPPQR